MTRPVPLAEAEARQLFAQLTDCDPATIATGFAVTWHEDGRVCTGMSHDPADPQTAADYAELLEDCAARLRAGLL